MPAWNVKYVSFIIIISFISTSNAGLINKKNNRVAVKEIVQKIYNLTAKSLLHSTPEEKNKVLQSIEAKLRNSSKLLGPKADSYVELIMKGIQIMANNNAPPTTPLRPEDEVSGLRSRSDTKPSESVPTRDRVKQMADKIFHLAKKHFRNAKTDEEKQHIIESIRQKVLDAAKNKHDLIHSKHAEIKTYTDLITRGMELMMDEITQKKRRMIMEFVNNKVADPAEEDYKKLEQRTNFLRDADSQDERAESDSNTLQEENNQPTEMTAFTPGSTPFSCNEVLRQTCSDIQSLHQFVCSDSRVISLDKLCDGTIDCTDGSDERVCINEARKRLHRATDIMSRVEILLLRKCFLEDDNSLLHKQNGVLYEVLHKQSGFLDKYKHINRANSDFGDVNDFKQTLNDMSVVITTLAVALDSSLCKRYLLQSKAEITARKYIPVVVEKEDDFVTKPDISLKSCKCFGSFCSNMTCPEDCKRVCWHRYNLGKWSCQAVDETTAISLDTVCDGKLDCYDESDEVGCNSGINPSRFEANDVFQRILKMLETKIISKQYLRFKSKLVLLVNSIKSLQKEVMKSKVDVLDVKNKRDKSFATLSSIYEDLLEKSSWEFDLEDAQFFLLNVNEQLMVALKHSNTGNDKIISPDGCFCRNGKCAVVHCSKGCTRACAVESKLTKYVCKGDKDVSVSIDKLCDKNAECPLEDDEDGCKTEVCRNHHLLLLRNSIREVGDNIKGTSLGETLQSWKTKVSSKLKIAENNYRPTRISFRDTISEALSDLVVSYAAAEETRRTQGTAFNEFFSLAQRVISAVKSCGQ